MLYFVATPIGNLKDISQRAIEVLSLVDEIGCEDTRNSIKLLNYLKINKPLFSYHKFNENAVCQSIIEKLKNGKNIAIISDSGTPVVSDPGNVLTKKLTEESVPYTIIPGACAVISALVLSGLDASRFSFIGFLPDKNSEQLEILDNIKYLKSTLIFYVSPHNIVKTLEKLGQYFSGRKASLICEISKIYERVYNFVLGGKIEIVEKGEMVLVVEGYTKTDEQNDLTVEEHVAFYMSQNKTKMEAIKLVAKDRKIDKSIIYKKINK